MVTLTGLVTLVAVAGSAFATTNGPKAILKKMTIYAASLSAIFLSIFAIFAVYDLSSGNLSIGLIGFYVACGVLVWNSTKDIFQAKFLADVMTIASHKANEVQLSIAARAQKLADEASAASKSAKP
jgi:hypothetical protein